MRIIRLTDPAGALAELLWHPPLTKMWRRDERVRNAFFIVEPNSRQIAEFGDVIERGHLQAAVDTVVPLERASDAFTGKVKEWRGGGKIVVTVAPQEDAQLPA